MGVRLIELRGYLIGIVVEHWRIRIRTKWIGIRIGIRIRIRLGIRLEWRRVITLRWLIIN